ncbi:MAG: DNA-binding protein [Acidobacteriota bacterium]|nr:DNA-binding protein [Acidobacteriota bacterium]
MSYFPVRIAMMVAGSLLMAAAGATSQMRGGRMGMGMYNTATETTIKGTVEEIKNPARGPMMGEHLVVKTADATLEVALGPAQFIESKGFTFAKGDAVEITGSKVTMGQTEYVIALEVVKDGKTLTLRDKDGSPLWAGKMRGAMSRP